MFEQLLVRELRAVHDLLKGERVAVVEGQQDAHTEGGHRHEVGLLQITQLELSWTQVDDNTDSEKLFICGYFLFYSVQLIGGVHSNIG